MFIKLVLLWLPVLPTQALTLNLVLELRPVPPARTLGRGSIGLRGLVPIGTTAIGDQMTGLGDYRTSHVWFCTSLSSFVRSLYASFAMRIYVLTCGLQFSTH